MAFDDVCKGIYITTCLLSFINCCINHGRTSNWKKEFLMDCFYFNNILIQILRFAYFPVTNSKEKNLFHGHFKEQVPFKPLIFCECFVEPSPVIFSPPTFKISSLHAHALLFSHWFFCSFPTQLQLYACEQKISCLW